MGDEPVDLVGFSFGGMTAGLLLAAHPQLARRLVLVGAPAMGVVPGRQFELKAWRHLKTPQEQADIRARLADSTLYQTDLDQAVALQARDGVIEEELMAALERWETLSSHS